MNLNRKWKKFKAKLILIKKWKLNKMIIQKMGKLKRNKNNKNKNNIILLVENQKYVYKIV